MNSRVIQIAFFLIAGACLSCSARPEPEVDKIKLPPGFRMTVYARHVERARGMAFGPEGTLFVGNFGDPGKVYAVLDRDEDQRADRVVVIDSGMKWPVGLDIHKGDLYVSALNKILRYDDIEERLDDPPDPVIVTDALPTDRHHGWKFIKFGPDGLLYVPVGAPCNVCERRNPWYASVLRMKPDGQDIELFASGVRNTVGFDWHPESGTLWFTDNGRDWMGDNRPPDELNHAPEPGLHFGFPYLHGKDMWDPEYGAKGKRMDVEFVRPEIALGPHVAALGMRFYTGEMFPEQYRNQIFIAEHGSWNRTNKIGYRVTLVRLKTGRAVSYETFAEGWLQGEQAWGRPADVCVAPDGALLVSDDRAGIIYRISYEGK